MEFRPPTEYERAVLDRLLSFGFQGRDGLAAQLANVLVRPTGDPDNYGAVYLRVQGESIFVMRAVVVEGRGFDVDGVPIDFMLHVVDGYANELDVVKASGTPIECFPNPSALEVFVHPPFTRL